MALTRLLPQDRVQSRRLTAAGLTCVPPSGWFGIVGHQRERSLWHLQAGKGCRKSCRLSARRLRGNAIVPVIAIFVVMEFLEHPSYPLSIRKHMPVVSRIPYIPLSSGLPLVQASSNQPIRFMKLIPRGARNPKMTSIDSSLHPLSSTQQGTLSAISSTVAPETCMAFIRRIVSVI